MSGHQYALLVVGAIVVVGLGSYGLHLVLRPLFSRLAIALTGSDFDFISRNHAEGDGELDSKNLLWTLAMGVTQLVLLVGGLLLLATALRWVATGAWQ